MDRTALVVGATGIIGSHAARELIAEGWTVHGLARQPRRDVEGLRPVAADLLDPASLETALARVEPSHVFLTSWMRNATEAENIRVNGAMVRNLLQALAPKRSVRHVALVTGLKHYLGPFDRYAQEGSLPETPLREEQPRLDVENFYYAQEDEVYAAAARDGFTWSVHRPHTVIGEAVGNLMNMGTTLAVYASICKATGRPFRWPGSAGAVAGHHRHDRRAGAGQASGVGRDDRGGVERGVQHRQWRHLPLELAVAAAGALVRRRAHGLRRHGASARGRDGR